MALVAVQRLRWGDEDIEPGQPVPEGEAGRDYDGLLRLGQVVQVAAPVFSDEAAQAAFERVTEELAKVTAERDELAKQVEDLTAPAPPPDDSDEPSEPSDEDALPEGVTETSPGWYQLADGTKVHGRAALVAALAK